MIQDVFLYKKMNYTNFKQYIYIYKTYRLSQYIKFAIALGLPTLTTNIYVHGNFLWTNSR